MKALFKSVLGGARMFSTESIPLSEPEVLLNRRLPMTGILSSLSKEQRAKALSAPECESFGPAKFSLDAKNS